MRWGDIRGILDLLGALAGSLGGRKGKRFAKRLEKYVGDVGKFEVLRNRWLAAEAAGTSLTLDAADLAYLKEVREKAL